MSKASHNTCNVKIAGNEITRHFLAEFKVQSTSSAMDSTNQKIIVNLAGAAKPMKKTNPPYLETKKGKPCPYSFKCINCRGKH